MPDNCGIIDRYRKFLPVSEKTPVITLLEGNTPLIKSKKIGPDVGVELYFKYEGLNPTGSFKDRGMTMAMSKAVEEGANAVICASTGNTSASAAAYAARAGLKSIVIIPKGKIALGKLSQAMAHGAQVFEVEGNFDDALKLVREMSGKHNIALVNSLNPYRLDGQKTGAFEICDDLGEAPDYHFIPVGNAGNITAYWMGYKEYKEAGVINVLPRMMGYQAAGAAPIVLGRPVKEPETIATAIRIGNPARWKEAEAAASESRGKIDMVTDEEILAAYRQVAREEGIFVEPASAASIAGLIKARSQGLIDKKSVCVAILTGHGLKDPSTAIGSGKEIRTIKDLSELEQAVYGGE